MAYSCLSSKAIPAMASSRFTSLFTSKVVGGFALGPDYLVGKTCERYKSLLFTLLLIRFAVAMFSWVFRDYETLLALWLLTFAF